MQAIVERLLLVGMIVVLIFFEYRMMAYGVNDALTSAWALLILVIALQFNKQAPRVARAIAGYLTGDY